MSNQKTVVFSSKNFPSDATKEDIAKKFYTEFHEQYEIFAIQVKPGNVVAVTFTATEAKKTLTKNEFMDVDGIVCPVLNYAPATTLVMVHYFPVEADGKPLFDTLSQYGNVVGSRFQVWTHLGDISTGTRLYHMHLSSDVPRSLTVRGHRVKVWYKGQPLACDICGGGHKAAQCELRGKCRRCKSEGHFAKDCKNPPWGNNASAPVPPTPGSDPTPAEAAGRKQSSQAPVVPINSASNVEDNVSQPPVVDVVDGASPPSNAVDSVAGASQSMVDMDDSASQSILAGVEIPAAPPAKDSGEAALCDSGQSADLRDNQLDELPSSDAGSQSAPEAVVHDVPVVTVLSEGDSLANVALGEFPLEEVLSASASEPADPSTPPSSSSPVCSPIVDKEGFVKPPLPPRPRKHFKVSGAALERSRPVSPGRSSVESKRNRSVSPIGHVRSRSPVAQPADDGCASGLSRERSRLDHSKDDSISGSSSPPCS